MSEDNNVRYIRNPENHKSIFFPVLLIIVGLFFLLSNLNMISGDAKSLLIRFWPLLFVIGGLEDLINKKWVGAIINVGIGAILVLANMGYFPWTAWEMIWKIWPIFIIAIGLQVAFKGQNLIGSIIGVFVSVLIVTGILWVALNSSLVGKGVINQVGYDLGNVKQASIELVPAIGSLMITNGAPSTQLLSGEITLTNEEKLLEDYETNGSIGELKLKSEGIVIFPSKTANGGFPWDVQLNDMVVLELNVIQGVGEQDLDLSGLDLTKFNIKLGVGQSIVELPEESIFNGSIDCAIGELIVYVPEGLPIKINLDTAITSTNYPDSFTRDGDWLYSPNGRGSADVRTLTLNNPIGSLVIRTK